MFTIVLHVCGVKGGRAVHAKEHVRGGVRARSRSDVHERVKRMMDVLGLCRGPGVCMLHPGHICCKVTEMWIHQQAAVELDRPAN